MIKNILKALCCAAIWMTATVALNLCFFKEPHITWISIIVAVSIFIYIVIRLSIYQDKDEIKLAVAAECTDKTSAEAICKMLEANDIKAMVVEKNSPVYAENASYIAPVQVQVAHKDLKKAEKLINE